MSMLCRQKAEIFETPKYVYDAVRLVCYRKQDWAGALRVIEASRCDCERFGLLGLLETFTERIQRLQQSPPNADWDGVFTAEAK